MVCISLSVASTCLYITNLYYKYRIIPGAVCITLFIPLYYPLHLHRHLWPPQRPGGANLAPDLPADQNAAVLFTYSWRKAKLLNLTKRANMIFGKSRPCANKYGSKFKSSPYLAYNQSHISEEQKQNRCWIGRNRKNDFTRHLNVLIKWRQGRPSGPKRGIFIHGEGVQKSYGF